MSTSCFVGSSCQDHKRNGWNGIGLITSQFVGFRPGLILGSSTVLVAHEGLHVLAMAKVGARSVYGTEMIGKVFPASCCRPCGFRFTRMQYLIVALTQLLLLSAVGSVVLQLTYWFPLILILTLNAGGAVGDLWMAGMIARKPVGTMFEDLKDGVRILEPTDQSESS